MTKSGSWSRQTSILRIRRQIELNRIAAQAFWGAERLADGAQAPSQRSQGVFGLGEQFLGRAPPADGALLKKQPREQHPRLMAPQDPLDATVVQDRRPAYQAYLESHRTSLNRTRSPNDMTVDREKNREKDPAALFRLLTIESNGDSVVSGYGPTGACLPPRWTHGANRRDR